MRDESSRYPAGDSAISLREGAAMRRRPSRHANDCAAALARNNAASGFGAFCVSLPAPGGEDNDAGNRYGEQKKLEHSIASVWRQTKQSLDEVHVRLLPLFECRKKKALRSFAMIDRAKDDAGRSAE
jgi:hypothetical protein